MAGIANFRIPPPAKWQDFEDLCADLWRRIWKDENTQKNGRQGQPQNGVDIFGRPDKGPSWSGVQCKDKNEDLGSALTDRELRREVAKAQQFTPKLSAFTIATTGPRDSAIQERARLLTEEHRKTGLFDVAVWCWEDILARLNDFPEVIALHFPHFRPAHILESETAAATEDSKTDTTRTAAADTFMPPRYTKRMLPREALLRIVEDHLKTQGSVFLTAPSGYGKSVLLSQIRTEDTIWVDCEQEERQFSSFRERLNGYVRARYAVESTPESPRDLARALDRTVGASPDRLLVIAVDHADNIDNGVKAFLHEIVAASTHVRVIVSASHLRLKRQHALQASGRLRIVSASELAFTKDETIKVLTAPLNAAGDSPSQDFAAFVFHITDGWPIAVQLIRARLEHDPDEDAAVRALGNIARKELGPYLLESYWTTLDPLLKSLLVTTSIFYTFDRSDAEAIMAGQDLEPAWAELTALPFVSHPPRAESFLVYQPLFRTFLSDRLSRERSPADVRLLHRAAASHFLDDKWVPPAAVHHARLADDSALQIRATGQMADFTFSNGLYPLLREVINQVSPMTRWEDSTLALYQGRLDEHDRDLTNALKWYRRAQELFEQHGPAFWRIGIVSDIGGILRKTGHLDEALALYDDALARLGAETPSSERAGLVANRANVLLQRGSLDEAEKGFLAAREIFELNRNADGLSRSYQGLAHVAAERKDDDAAFRLFTKALHWLRRADDTSGLAHVAAPVAQRLMNRGRHRLAHAIYAVALQSAARSEAPDLLPLLLTNFGLTGALLPEPDAAGVGALLTARELKRASGRPYGGTLQNLSILLIRLGEFRQALEVVREQADVAKRSNDASLADDAAAKRIYLDSYFAGAPEPDPFAKQPSAGSRNYMLGAQTMMMEGRARSVLKKRWPMIHELISDGQGDAVTIAAKTFELQHAQTILVLSRDGTRSEADANVPDAEQNLILELLWEPTVSTDETHAQADSQMAAIWWVRSGSYCWVQAFWHERQPGTDRAGVAALKGSLFSLDQTTGRWNPADHPEACDCGRLDMHESLREFGSAIVSTFGSSRQRDVTINRRKYPLLRPGDVPNIQSEADEPDSASAL